MGCVSIGGRLPQIYSQAHHDSLVQTITDHLNAEFQGTLITADAQVNGVGYEQYFWLGGRERFGNFWYNTAMGEGSWIWDWGGASFPSGNPLGIQGSLLRGLNRSRSSRSSMVECARVTKIVIFGDDVTALRVARK